MLALIILFSSIFLVSLIYRTTRPRPHLPPGPSGLPLIGNLHQLPNSAPHRYLWRLSKQYGPLIFLRFGLKPTIVVSSAKIASQVMKTHDLVYASRPSLLGQQKLSYNGLDVAFAPYSDYWREVKKLCVLHLFSSRRIHSFRPIREDEVLRTIHRLSQSAASHREINLSKTMMSFTGTLICRIAFGKRYELEDNKVSEKGGFHGLLHESEALLTEFYFSDYIPCLGWIDRIRGLHSRLDKTFKQLDMFYQQVIDDHMKPKNPQTDEKDVIDIFLQIMNDHSSSVDLTMDHIKALLMNILIAGTDTSAATLVWAMTSLMKNPRVMKKVQGEIRKLYGDKEFTSEEDIERLPYLRAVVKEALRLFPASPLLVPRESMEKCNIEGYEIQAKTLVFVNAWAIARDPETWEDPEQFYPERFLDCSIDFKGQDFELIPFGAGRRICPGIQMGVITVELMLANLVHCFDWELPDGIEEQDIDTEVIPGITMHKKNDLCLLAKNHIALPLQAE
ncbi:hypothetical protein QN277_017998 [Acacia crassicarpa]|uniref:Cytochrome P450 n=1 Tax=Acacia crassicarpa TaxID=499986 RepID=A0AAE1JPM8_9FABA|nr:hypothetical protein QN277_017998 [Acacia crassicarpa]